MTLFNPPSIPLRPLYDTMPHIDFINGFPNQPWGCICTSATATKKEKPLKLKKIVNNQYSSYDYLQSLVLRV